MEDKIEVTVEGALFIKNNGKLIAIVHNDKVQTFFSCKEMCQDDVKDLLETLNGWQPKGI